MKNVLKQFLLVFTAGVLITSCNNANSPSVDSSNEPVAKTESPQPMNYPYTIDHPDNWVPGSQQNTLVALKALKAWENKNMDESLTYFADSVHVQFDGIDKKVSNDSLRAMITSPPSIKNQSVKMQDWESVISKDKSEEYVTLWYREYMENDKGQKDSMDVVNDLKMKDGKIIGLDQYIRKLH